MLRAATCWYRWDKKENQWKYNHFEFGKNEDDHPTPQSEQQQGWNNIQWAKRYGYFQKALGRTSLVEESELITFNGG